MCVGVVVAVSLQELGKKNRDRLGILTAKLKFLEFLFVCLLCAETTFFFQNFRNLFVRGLEKIVVMNKICIPVILFGPVRQFFDQISHFLLFLDFCDHFWSLFVQI